jgi:hypothetical protein
MPSLIALILRAQKSATATARCRNLRESSSRGSLLSGAGAPLVGQGLTVGQGPVAGQDEQPRFDARRSG